MTSVAKTRILSFFATLIIVPFITYLVILFARGYRPDFTAKKLEPTGILAATSHPEGAQIIINNQIHTATNNSVNLTPGLYDVQIKKEGFHTWTKQLLIEKEIVTAANAYLFATVPTLKAVTDNGAQKPNLAKSLDKLVYFTNQNKKLNLVLLELSESPLGILNREPQILVSDLRLKPNDYRLLWSPDSRQLLLQSSSSAQLVDINSNRITESSIGLPEQITDWKSKEESQYLRQLASLPAKIRDLFATSSGKLIWSGSEKKILYTATASATLPNNLLPPLPGSSTQTQSRQLTPGHTYTYDLEEDRNFEVGNESESWHWYPTGSHIYRIDKNNIHIKEYDNGNPITFFAGNLAESFAVPYPSGKQLLVLINADTKPTTLPNFYTVNLK